MERIGKFQLRKLLGKGASGTVYLALDTFSGADVALKVLDPQVVSSPDFERTIATQFLNEASDRFTWLKKVPLLEHLGDSEIWELVHAGHWSRVPPRQPIVKEGDDGKSLFFLASGQAKVTKQGRLLNVLNAGECFGEMAYIKAGGIPRQATVESMADTVLAEFDADALAKCSLNCRLQLSIALLHSLVDRLALANERMARATQ